MGKVVIINHPLINHKLTIVRSKETKMKEFREALSEISGLMAYEVTRDLKTKKAIIETPNCQMDGQVIDKQIVIVPILRAGLGMVEGIANVIPTAKVGHIGLFRNEDTLTPELYYMKLPNNIEKSIVYLVDPMLATGGSASEALMILKNHGVKTPRFIGIVGCMEGIKRIEKEHPDVDIYLAACDQRLNENGYIIPGLGDCGDRLFGTKVK